MRRDSLYLIAALIWGLPGVTISIKGFTAYGDVLPAKVWWLIPLSIAIATSFFYIFRRVVAKYSVRISEMSDKVSFWDTFPKSGWALLLFMMGLGILLGNIPNIPLEFTASFYSGLGPMLILAAIRFVINRNSE